MTNPIQKFIACLDAKGIQHSNKSDGVRFACPAHGGSGDSAVASVGQHGLLRMRNRNVLLTKGGTTYDGLF